jgi:hypothetical protein
LPRRSWWLEKGLSREKIGSRVHAAGPAGRKHGWASRRPRRENKSKSVRRPISLPLNARIGISALPRTTIDARGAPLPTRHPKTFFNYSYFHDNLPRQHTKEQQQQTQARPRPEDRLLGNTANSSEQIAHGNAEFACSLWRRRTALPTPPGFIDPLPWRHASQLSSSLCRRLLDTDSLGRHAQLRVAARPRTIPHWVSWSPARRPLTNAQLSAQKTKPFSPWVLFLVTESSF